jgi:lysozyme
MLDGCFPMNENLRTSPNGISLLKQHEGLRLKAYQDSRGVWTIGYGLTSAAGIVKVYKGMTITREQAEEYFRLALVKYENCIKETIRIPLEQHQFDALVSFCYNVGPGAFEGSSIAQYVNQKRFKDVPKRMALWIRAGKVYPKGLKKRRKDEGDVFLGRKDFAATERQPDGA